MRRQVRGGFTLVELLVVIAIIGVLVGLLMPAVQSARETGRSAECKNKLAQVSKALLQHQEQFRMLPCYTTDHAQIGYVNRGRTNPSKVYFRGNWFCYILGFLDQQAMYDELVGSANKSDYEYGIPATTDYRPAYWDPSCKWIADENPSMEPEILDVGHVFEPPDKYNGHYDCTGSTYFPTIGHGPQNPQYNGLDKPGICDVVYDVLLCPSDPSVSGSPVATFRYNHAFAFTNYNANWNAFNVNGYNWDLIGYPRMASIMPHANLTKFDDGTSNTILLGETMAQCGSKKRFAYWSEAFYNKDQTNPPWRYPSASFGINWYADPNTYIFQDRPPVRQCNNWRMQAMHPGGLHVAMADGAVKTISVDIARQEVTDPIKTAISQSGNYPYPYSLEKLVVDDTTNTNNLPLKVWDKLLLPRDGQVLEGY